MRRRATSRLLFGGDSAPFFALVGISLASGSGILTKEDELEGVCWEIRVSRAFSIEILSQLLILGVAGGCHEIAMEQA